MAIYLRGKSWYYDFVHKGQRYTGSFGPVSKTVAKEELARKKAEVIEGKLNPTKARKSLLAARGLWHFFRGELPRFFSRANLTSAAGRSGCTASAPASRPGTSPWPRRSRPSRR